MVKNLSFFIILLLFVPKLTFSQISWNHIQAGLWSSEVICHPSAQDSPAVYFIIRFDPHKFHLLLLSEKEFSDKKRTLSQWGEDFQLLAGTNAGMFAQDYLSHTGYLKKDGKIYNSQINAQYGALLVFDPAIEELPFIQILDRTVDDWEKGLGQYRSAVQNFRLTGPRGENLWKEKGDRNSIAAFGIDQEDRALFVFCETPVSVFYFNECLTFLSLKLKRAMYLEGGSYAGLYFKWGKDHWIKSGKTMVSQETGLVGELVIPNILGIEGKE